MLDGDFQILDVIPRINGTDHFPDAIIGKLCKARRICMAVPYTGFSEPMISVLRATGEPGKNACIFQIWNVQCVNEPITCIHSEKERGSYGVQTC